VTAYLVAGLTVSALGPRAAIGIAAGGTLAILVYAVVALRRAPDPVLEAVDEGEPAASAGDVAVEPVGGR
jgi:hypothetical protein